ncbi:MAG: hypothetical protein JXC85_04005 [Candidatus Aenigmarchaeota archaeon]|nr:hypothetical protein [Candidatus Aenigmarchaeota archaeon]
MKTRTNYRCSEATGYQCESYVEEAECIVETTEGDNAGSTVDDSIPETSPGLDAAGDCSLLTPEDIMNVCGVNTTIEIQEPDEDEACVTRFVKTGTKYADRIYQSATIRYNTDYDPETDDVNTLITNLENNLGAERLTDHAVYVGMAGNWSIIYGTKYRIIVHNYVPLRPDAMCTYDQIKTLGILVSDRIYG